MIVGVESYMNMKATSACRKQRACVIECPLHGFPLCSRPERLTKAMRYALAQRVSQHGERAGLSYVDFEC